jgi:hypothetical protein
MNQLERIMKGDFHGIHPNLIPMQTRDFDDIITFSSNTSANIPHLRETIRHVLDYHAEQEMRKDHRSPPQSFKDYRERQLIRTTEDLTVVI